PFSRPPQSLAERHGRLPVDQTTYLGDVGATPTWTICQVVGIGIGNQTNLSAPRQSRHLVSQVFDCDLLIVADVENLAMDITNHEQQYGRYRIGHVAETACYPAIAEDANFAAFQRISNKVRDHSPVVEAHTRAVNVERTNDYYRQTELAIVRKTQGFRQSLRFIITGTRPGRGDVSSVGLGRSNCLGNRIAVNFTGTQVNETPGLTAPSEFKQVASTNYIHINSLKWKLTVLCRRCNAGSVDEICYIFVQAQGDNKIMLDESKISSILQVSNAGRYSSRKVVNANKPTWLRENRIICPSDSIKQIAWQKASASRH